ncbi:MAG: hypothetical protein PVG50_04605 [Thiohalophilus sp.]|jgi:hypothetical protein
MKYFYFLLMLSVFAVNPAFAEDSEQAKTLSGISIVGNKEAPKALYIVPWKSSEIGIETSLTSGLMDESLRPVDKEVFQRQLDFYNAVLDKP